MNTDEIRYFIAMCGSESISHAAADLHITPQGLGASLRRFEKKLGVKLFVRTASGTVPTEAARFLETRFRDMIAIEDEVLDYLHESTRKDKTRRMIGRDSALGVAISQGIDEYSRTHRDTPVEFDLIRDSEGNIARKFIDEGYDYRFCTTEVDALPELPRERLCRLRFVPVVNSQWDLAQRGCISIDDLRSCTILTDNTTFVWTQILILRCRERGFEPRIRELDRDYLVGLLADTSDTVHFIKDVDRERAPWNEERFTILPWAKGSSLDATIVMQTTKASMDRELAACVKDRLASLGYGVA